MKEIKVTTPFLVDGAQVDIVKVKPISFVPYVELVERALARAPKGAKPAAAIQRERFKVQAQFFANGKQVTPDDPAISQIPIPVAKAIIAALDDDEAKQGEILSDGNGIDTAILYKLGTPIPMQGEKARPITELEFYARVYGDVEDVLASSDSPMAQAVALIRQVGKPIEIESLQTLPDWALRQISVADGVRIARDILPRFLE